MKVLTNSNIVYGEIEKIVENSNEFVYIVSPFIKFDVKDHNSYQKFWKAINVAIKKNVEINFISRPPKSPSKGDPEEKLKDFTEKGCNLLRLSPFSIKPLHEERLTEPVLHPVMIILHKKHRKWEGLFIRQT